MNILKRWFTPKIEENIDKGQNPWAGLASYEDPATAERKLKFCGRDDDSYDVAKLIMGNTFVTLYGKSGIGKTSLLNAGVFPELREEHFSPLSLRLGIRDDNNVQSYQTVILGAVNRAVSRIEEIDVIPVQEDQQSVDYLWKFFARHQFYDKDDNPTIPVVVFDQFEEVFRHNREEAETLLRQLDNCAVNGSSHRYELNVRFVVSIREDDLYRLEDSIDNCYLPALKRCRYRLRSLSEEDAHKVILVPGEGLFKTEEQEQIIKAIIQIAQNKEERINTNLLSLVCNRLYAESQEIGSSFISLSLVDSFVKGNPFERFYNEATRGFSNREKSYIEKRLVDSTGRRDSISESEFFTHVKNGSKLIDGKNRILQRTSTSSDGKIYRIELIHDSFAEAINSLKKHKEKKGKVRLLKIACGFLVCFMMFSLGYYLLTPHYDTPEHLGLFEKNNLKLNINSHFSTGLYQNHIVEELNVNDNGGYFAVSNCSNLKRLRIHSNVNNHIDLDINNCPSLYEVTLLPDNIESVTFLIKNSPKVVLPINKNIKYINVRADNVHQITFDVKNNNYLWKRHAKKDDYDSTGFVLWDLRNKVIAYSQPMVPHCISFPYSKDTDYYRGRQFKNETSFNNTKRKGDVLEINGSKAFGTNLQDKDVKEIVFLDSVESIEENAFANMSFEKVCFSKNLKTIDKHAFVHCYNLKEVIFPDSLIYIGEEAFKECSSLERIVFQNKKSIELSTRVFAYCKNLKSVTLPDSIKTFERTNFYTMNPFLECPKLKNFITSKRKANTLFCKDSIIFSRDTSSYIRDSFPLWGYASYYPNPTLGLIAKHGVLFNNYEYVVPYLSISCNAAIVPSLSFLDDNFPVLTNRDNAIFNTYTFNGQYICDVYNAGKIKILHIPFGFIKQHPIKYSFIETPYELTELHLPYKQPASNKESIWVELDDTLKQRIVLYVPNGCSKYYKNNPNFTAFKSIEEDTNWDECINYINYGMNYLERSFRLFFLLPTWLIALVFITAIGIFYAYGKFIYWLKNVSEKYLVEKKHHSMWIYFVISPIVTILLGGAIYGAIYLMIIPNEIIAIICAIPLAVTLCFVFFLS